MRHGTRIDAHERLRIATSAAGIGVWEWDLADNTMIYSPIARAICGFSPDQRITFELVSDITHPEDLPDTSAAARRALDPSLRENSVFHYRIRRYDTGEVRWVLAYGEALFDDVSGEALSYVGTLQDVTEQHLVEGQLAESEARLRMAMDAADLAVWEIDFETGALSGSPELSRLCGFSETERPTLNDFRARYAPGEDERLSSEWEAMTTRGETRIESEFCMIWPDGTERWLFIRANILPKSGGSGQRLLGVLMDVTERKRHEMRLDLLNQELRHRIKNSMAVVGTLASAAITGGGDPQQARRRFQERLVAIGSATDLILSKAQEQVGLRELVQTIIAPYQAGRIVLSGPDVLIGDKVARNLGLALHELATNALKYGSLSIDEGGVDISWSLKDDWLTAVWQERGGPEVAPPTTLGFGSRLMKRGIFAPPESATSEYLPSGVRCTILVKLRP
ncbi:MAG: signal transduction histidine kinase [Devosia sp.]|nr:signal transduction histidine kinase [Devosia sp.]